MVERCLLLRERVEFDLDVRPALGVWSDVQADPGGRGDVEVEDAHRTDRLAVQDDVHELRRLGGNGRFGITHGTLRVVAFDQGRCARTDARVVPLSLLGSSDSHSGRTS